MLTGTPLDLTFIPELLAWLGKVIPMVWLLLLVGSLVFVWRRALTRIGRAVGVVAVLAVLVVAPLLKLDEWHKQALAKQAELEAFKVDLAKAETLFKKRCETAGEFIYKTARDVKGVVWMRWRDGRGRRPDESYQFALDDPYGGDCGDESCVQQLLRSTFVVPNHDMNRPPLPESGYEFVETTDPRDGLTYRYVAGILATGKRTPESRAEATRNSNGVDPGDEIFGFGIQRQPIDGFTARYGITWDDISTHEDRENWIAGGSITVVDLKTNEVIAKRVGYMVDRGLGATTGFRDPWGSARYVRESNCPAIPARSATDSRGVLRDTEKTVFLFKVLQPTEGERK